MKNLERLVILVVFGIYQLDRHREGVNINYDRWIVIFLFIIVWSIVNLKDKK